MVRVHVGAGDTLHLQGCAPYFDHGFIIAASKFTSDVRISWRLLRKCRTLLRCLYSGRFSPSLYKRLRKDDPKWKGNALYL